MTFRVLDGDLFSKDIQVIVHGANCFNTMGSGVARIIHDEYPLAYVEDCKTIKGDKNKLGTYTFWTGPHFRIPNKTVTIVNAYSQYDFGRNPNQVFANYEAITKVMNKINQDFPVSIIALPFLGAGLAGGSPQIILDIFLNAFKTSSNDVTLYLIPGQFPEVRRGSY